MCQIVILTRNIEEDKPLREKLEDLGHEVFCSRSMVTQFLDGNPLVASDFPIVLLSATLTNELVGQLLAKQQLAAKVVIRCDWSEPEDDLLAQWTSLGLTATMTMDMPLSMLRDLFASHVSKQKGTGLLAVSESKVTTSSLKQVIETFSRAETSLFTMLYQEKGNFLTRQEVAYRIWGGAPTNSNLAQLSQLVNRIRTKLKIKGLPEQLIETHWKRGYRITILFEESEY